MLRYIILFLLIPIFAVAQKPGDIVPPSVDCDGAVMKLVNGIFTTVVQDTCYCLSNGDQIIEYSTCYTQSVAFIETVAGACAKEFSGPVVVDSLITFSPLGDTIVTSILADGSTIKSVCALAPSMDSLILTTADGSQDSVKIYTNQYGFQWETKCPVYVEPLGTTIEALDTSLVITCKKNYTFNISDLITADCLGADYSIGLCSDIPPGVDIDFDDTGYVSIEVDCSCLPDTYSPFVFQYEATCDNSEATTSKGTITVDIERIEALKNGSYEPMASYTYTVCNTGSTPITGITGTDQTSEGVNIPVLGGPIDLAVGQCDHVSFTSLYTPSAQDFTNGFIRNTATFSGTGPTGNTVSDTSDDATDNNNDGIPDNDANQDLNGDGEQDDYTELGLGCDDLEVLNATNPQLVKDIMLLPSYPQSSECDEDDIFFPDYLEAQLCDQTGIQFDPFNEDDDQCGSLINASFDFCNHCLVVAPNSDICDLDCDGDGLTNQEECDAGTDPNDPTDVCEFIALMNIACDDATWLHILQLADCDNGGTPNWWDCANTGGDPTVPTDDCDQAVNNNLNICLLINGDPNHPFAALDCDGGGVDNLTECQNGGSPSDSNDDIIEVELFKNMKLLAGYAEGDDVEATLTYCNSGNYDVDEWLLSDDWMGTDVTIANTLAPGQCATHVYTFQIPSPLPDSIINIATVVGTNTTYVDGNGNNLTDTDIADDDGAGDSTSGDIAGTGTTDDDPSILGPVACSGTVKNLRVAYRHDNLAAAIPDPLTFPSVVIVNPYLMVFNEGTTTTATTATIVGDELTGIQKPISPGNSIILSFSEFLFVGLTEPDNTQLVAQDPTLSYHQVMAQDFVMTSNPWCDDYTMVKAKSEWINQGASQLGASVQQPYMKTCWRVTFTGASGIIDNDGNWTQMSSAGGTEVWEICVSGDPAASGATPNGLAWLPNMGYGPYFEGLADTFHLEMISNECIDPDGTCASNIGPGANRISMYDNWTMTCCN